MTVYGTLSDYAKKKAADLFFGAQAYTAPVTLYVGLWTASLTDASTGVTAGEVSGGSYARLAVTNNLTNFPAASGSGTVSKSNGTLLTFVTATADWGTVTDIAIVDSSSGAGNIIAHGQVLDPTALTPVSRVVKNGDTVLINITKFSLQIT